METFAQLGIPFPLFEAPVTEASDYIGLSDCGFCGEKKQHCFSLGIGDAIVVPCSNCEAENALSASDRIDVSCRACDEMISFPPVHSGENGIQICYACLRAGKGCITKSTELGLVSWGQAFDGVTGGVPELNSTEFEMVLLYPEDDWYGAHVPSQHLFELLRTPCFHSWQDETWLFCCKKPMTYTGGWETVATSLQSYEREKKFFESMRPEAQDLAEWEWIGEKIFNPQSGFSAYLYLCKECGCQQVTWDSG